VKQNLSRRPSGLPGLGIATPLLRHHQHLAAVDLDRITGGQLPPASGLNKAMDLDVTSLDALLGLTPGADKTLPLQKLIELHALSAGVHGGTLADWD